MLADLFPPEHRSAASPALVELDGETSWNAFATQVSEVAESHGDLCGQRVGLQLAARSTSLVHFFGLLQAGAHPFLMAVQPAQDGARTVHPPEARSRLEQWVQDFGLAEVITAEGARQSLAATHTKPGTPAGITILTSGTTGKPKAVEHTWAGLIRPVRRTPSAGAARWLLTYRPHLYAGLQVMLQCLLNQGTLILAPSDGSAEAVVELAVRGQAEFASATPSYWRWLLTFAGKSLKAIPLQQITLGGEAVDQQILDALQRCFPAARLVHIYATTELGRCFSVTDGRAGFPADYLDQASADGVEMRIVEGELVVRSANAMSGYDGSDASPRSEWFHTADLVERMGDRVQFVGRKTDMINVGGNKVYPVEVERFVRAVPGVADVRVYGESSSIVGELVKCDVVVCEGFDAKQVEADIRKQSFDGLTSYQRPRFIAFVDEIPRTSAGKVQR